MNVELRIDVRLQHAVALRLRAGGADQQSGGVLQSALRLQTGGGGAAMAVAGLQDARVFLPRELCDVRTRKQEKTRQL